MNSKIVGVILAIATVSTIGCVTPLADMRFGTPRPARADDCKLEVVNVSVQEMMSDASQFGPKGEFERIGQVVVAASNGTDPFDPKVRDEVRPRACRLGGEAISLTAAATPQSAPIGAQASIVFEVWAKKVAQPAAPATF